MNYVLSRLPNGIRHVAAPLSERKSVAVGIWVEAGGRDEEPRVSGISHFLEHMVFKGTSRRSMYEIKESVEGVGGSLNAFTTEEFTCFLAKAGRPHFEKVLDVLADIVVNASLKKADILKERTVIMEEIKMTQDQPSHLAEEILTGLLWPGHALGRPLAGTLETVGRLGREDLLRYHRRFYGPRFMTVAAAGAIEPAELKRAVEKRLGRLRGPAEKPVRLFQPSAQGRRCRVRFKKTEQTHLAFAVHAFSREHPDEYALDLLNVILGGNMSSRLFNEVRENRGLAYDIGTYVRKYHETGAFGVEAGVDNRRVLQALDVILKELEKISKKSVKDDELKRAKEFYTGQLELGLENSMNHMLWVGENAVSLGRCKEPGEVTRRIGQIRASDLKRVAQRVFRNGGFRLALVGPHSAQMERKISRLLS